MIAIVAILASSAMVNAQSTEKCFMNQGLKDGHEISMNINGKALKGEFRVARDFETENPEKYPFTGTINGSLLTVKFDGEAPDALPIRPTAKKWSIVRAGGQEKLRVILFGKNYVTNKWGNYTVDYRSCSSPYSEAAGTAKRVTFAKGTTSAVLEVTFTAKDQKRAYWLGLREGQQVAVSAPGCGISFWYPDKTPYEEGTAVDNWSNDSLPQTGDYLFVISPAGQPGVCSISIKAK
ncbi:hypothetical protein BH10ACI3_BH10ACI3_16540 [soil metagenome]